MRGYAHAPVVAACAAILWIAVLAVQDKRRWALSAWLHLIPVAFVPLVGGWAADRLLAAGSPDAHDTLASGAFLSALTLSAAAFVLARAESRHLARSARAADGLGALAAGLGLTAALVYLWRSDVGTRLAAVPAVIGVGSVWLGTRGLERRGVDPVRAGRAAMDTVLALGIALGAVACAAVAAASIALGSDAPAPQTLRRAACFALAPALTAALRLTKNASFIGRGARRRLAELFGTFGVLFLGVGALRIELTRLSAASAAAENGRPAPTPLASEPPVPSALPRQSNPVAPVPSASPPSSSSPAPVASAEAAMSFEHVKVGGMLAPGEVQKGVEKAKARIEKCCAAASAPGCDGELVVKLTIGDDGSVTNALAGEDSTISDHKLVACVLASFYQVGFPAPSEGNVQVIAPIRFHAGGHD
jgi:hypothetical protein